MFIVSEEAKKELKRMHESRSMEPGMYFRLAIPPIWTGFGDFGIVIDEEKIKQISEYSSRKEEIEIDLVISNKLTLLFNNMFLISSKI